MKNLYSNLMIINPKRHIGLSKISNARLFPYYAGYSIGFIEQLLDTLPLGSSSVVLDPWNGGGTTTQVASQMGFESIGFDLNPVMVIVAKAALLPQHEVSSLLPLAQSLVEQAAEREDPGLIADPLCEWFVPESTRFIRQVESEINRTLVSHERYIPLLTEMALSQISTMGAFFYVALFRAVRRLLKSFIPTNPTWIKRPHLRQRKRTSRNVFHDIFIDEVRLLTLHLNSSSNFPVKENGIARICLGNSESVSLPNASVDAIITSPPYCTRIDYAVATAIELSILRINEGLFNHLRRSLMGTSTVNNKVGTVIDLQWGRTCSRFLNMVYEHPSKASQSYYYKNHYKYFESLHSSIAELARVLKPKGTCVLVVQDSYYKDIHNDVPTIVTEMADHVGMTLHRREDFTSNRSMVSMNQRARKYLSSRKNMESVLCFERT